MKVVILIILIVFLAAAIVQITLIIREKNQLQARITDLNNRLKSLMDENAGLYSEIEYFSNPENLEKELRKKFNYKNINEKMIIVVP